jgi:hypothetical protein
MAPVRTSLLLALACAPSASAGGSLGIPTTIDGYPTNVGLLVLGHSTSAQGDYPAKLAAALNDPGNVGDGRSYMVLRAITGGDGGFLWSRLEVPPRTCSTTASRPRRDPAPWDRSGARTPPARAGPAGARRRRRS